MSKKRLSRISFFLLLLIFLFLFVLLGIRSFYQTDYAPAVCTEVSSELANPYIGWYHMYGYILGADTISNLPDQDSSDDTQDPGLILLEINLCRFSDQALSSSALSQLDTILSAWRKNGNQILLRFLYDWDGNAMESEPQSMDQIFQHMDQTAEIVNHYTDCIFLMQGAFVGNYGEMNNSHYLSDENCTALIQHLSDMTDPSIFLSVRTPAQRRRVLNSMEVPSEENAFDGSLFSRLGLYNDGMLGTANDTGTYGDTTASADAYRSAWVREDELSFQNKLCNFVPNGGEVILDNPYNDLENAVSDLARMHVSYLNSAYDTAVLDKWKNTIFEDETSIFNGLSGYDYIGRRLGYRYVVRGTSLDQSSLMIQLENVGFSIGYRKLDLQLTLVSDEGEVFSYPLSDDSRFWTPGNTIDLSVSLPFRELKKATYSVYFQMTDPSLQREIIPANSFSHSEYGYQIGSLELKKLV